MTQEILAERLNVSVGYVSQVERGITKISLGLLGKISAILDCDIAYLVSGSSVDNSKYLKSELADNISQLDKKEKNFILGVIKLLKQM